MEEFEKTELSSVQANDIEENLYSWVRVYVSFVYSHPYLIIGLFFALTVITTSIQFFLYGLSIKAEATFYRWSNSPIIDQWDAFSYASTQTYSSSLAKEQKFNTTLKQSTPSPPSMIIYERTNGNILDVDTIRSIWIMEEETWNTSGFTDYCFKPQYSTSIDSNTGCQYYTSFITALKSAMVLYHVTPSPDLLTQNFIDTVVFMNENVRVAFFSRNCTSSNLYSEVMRTIVTFGYPLSGYRNINDRYEDQKKNLSEWGYEFIKPIERLYDESPNGLKAYDFITGNIFLKTSSLIMSEVLWIIGSFTVTIIIVAYHLKSFFLATIGVIGTFCSIPLGLFFSYTVLGIHHFDAMNVLGLFLICGIGSDLIFMYFDLLRQSRYQAIKREIMPHIRLAIVAQHGMFATAVSALTTAICFISLISSGARVLRFFGIFCFFEVICDWLMGASVFIAGLAIWMQNYEDLHSIDESQTDDTIITESELHLIEKPNGSIFDFIFHVPTLYVTEDFGIDDSNNKYEKFIHNIMSPIIYHYRFPIVVLTILITLFFGYYALRIEGNVEIQFLGDGHPIQHGFTLFNNEFASRPDFSLIFVWGVKPNLSRTFRDELTIDGFGKSEFEIVNFSDPDNQQFLLYACDAISGSTAFVDSSVDDFLICPAKLLKDFAINHGYTYPIPPLIFNSILKDWQDDLSQSLGVNEPQLSSGRSLKDLIGFDLATGELKYIAMRVIMKLPGSLSSSNLKKIYDQVMLFENNLSLTAPNELKHGYSTSFYWVTMSTQELLVTSTFSGIIWSISFAIIVFFISTLSIIYTIIFAMALSLVVIIIIGIFERLGWGIGLSEAAMLTISSGFCCDYIIHTMLGMAKQQKFSLFGKLQSALTTYCTPVTLALLTTIGSAIFLYPSSIILFPPFATFLILSGILGLISGFFSFPALGSIVARKEGDNLYLLCQ